MSRLKVSVNLRAILNMADRLDTRALDLANSPLMPGGEAMVNLAHVADLGDWTRRNDLAADELANFEDPDELWSPFQILRYWSEQWRPEFNLDHDDPNWYPTLRSEANFLGNADVLTWAWDHELHYDDFAKDVARARSRLEGILREGERPDRIRVVCPDCESGKRLIIQYGRTEHFDQWKCPACKHRFDEDEVRRAYAKQLRGSGAARWVSLNDAISIMRKQGWREPTVRAWVDGTTVEAATDDTWQIFVWWPDLWRRHLAHRQARDIAKREAELRAMRKAECAEEHGPECWIHGRGCERALDRITAV